MKSCASLRARMLLTSLVIAGFLILASGASSSIKVFQQPVAVANNQRKANLVCSYTFTGKATEIRGTLLKRESRNSTVICASSYTTDCESFTVEGAIKCFGQPGKNNVTFTLSGLHANNSGIYICAIEIMYPPPYRTSIGNGTLLHVIDPEPCHESHLVEWILMGIIAALFIYSTLATAAIVLNKVQIKNWWISDLSAIKASGHVGQERKTNTYHILIN
ncbi:cytotoxic T-lymphocyte protein 4 [Lissotriton helveticus]